ncbi:hypothetical protein JSQ81_00665 [Sporosarcina sp. Marseille-Q4063]|uniref:YpoC family protein n=1 Tax=Sporosarcina sp. Marseille-Q4063 TaxID=2810514 RepID=UPI001BAF80C9|nr:hypothetical protein [Sporosarcina sp. Marseille-Q4063]QUW22140.1 hypothetical protein JSQ81_00665 [Sporosarcina sp. Marseille-Q4063]
MNRFSKELLAPHFEKWDLVKEEIEKLYSLKDKEVNTYMEVAIRDYEQLLEYGGSELNERTGNLDALLLPLNGEERLQFVKDRIASHYAYIQLDALYTETKKKAARLFVMKK